MKKLLAYVYILLYYLCVYIIILALLETAQLFLGNNNTYKFTKGTLSVSRVHCTGITCGVVYSGVFQFLFKNKSDTNLQKVSAYNYNIYSIVPFIQHK